MVEQPPGRAAQPEGNAQAPVLNIVGERVALGPVSRELIPTYNRWINNFTMVVNLGQEPRPITLDQSLSGYEGRLANEREVRFVIYERRPEASDRPIGVALLGDLDLRNRTAEYVVFIGEPEARGHGYGTEVTRLMLDYAFTTLGLHNVLLTVFEFNLGARRAYEKAGFKEIGRRRQAYLIGGRGWDVIYMDCLASEFSRPAVRSPGSM